MHLAKLYSKFIVRCRSYQNRKESIRLSQNSLPEWQHSYLTEVLLSDIWQSWCLFSRELFFSSCRGTTARNGQKIPPIQGEKSNKRLGYIAQQAKHGNTPKPHGHSNFMMYKEPTWGDIDIFIKIIQRVKPNNESVLLNSYGSFTQIKELQKVRNACAHKNVETITSILSMPHYRFIRLKKPTDVAWVSNIRGELSIEIWLDEAKKIALLSTETG